MIHLYDICIPVLLRYLDNLDGILVKAQAYLSDIDAEDGALLSQALRDDMLPLKSQLEVAIGFAMRTVRPLLSTPLTVHTGPIDTIDDIRLLAGHSRALLAAVPREALAGPDLMVREEAGDAIVECSALEFVTQYALPNVFFHMSIAYSLLRRAGCPIGKSDFDRFHHYVADGHVTLTVAPNSEHR